MTITLNGTTGITTPSDNISGNLAFTGTGNRITGDFSNATIASRVAFQTSTANNNTILEVLTTGTATTSALNLSNTNDNANCGIGQFQMNSASLTIASSIRGTGTYLPMTFQTSSLERVRIDTSGNVLVTSAAGLGYGTGAGSTVTQGTSKSTSVTLNRPTGQITMNPAALTASTTVAFACLNSLAAAIDTVVLTPVTSTIDMSSYQWGAAMNGAGNIRIYLRNITVGSLSEAVVFNFAIIKGAIT